MKEKKNLLTIFPAFGDRIPQIAEGDIHRFPVGKVSQRLLLTWLNLNLHGAFPGRRNKKVTKYILIIRAVGLDPVGI